MFIGEDILDFINKIINQADEKDKSIESNLKQFRSYLELTEMVDGDTLSRIDKILDCVEYLIALKSKLGFVDVKAIVLPEEEKEKKLKKVNRVSKSKLTPKTIVEEKHYHHYSSDYGSSCGSSSYYPSYSSGCGGGGSYRSGC